MDTDPIESSPPRKRRSTTPRPHQFPDRLGKKGSTMTGTATHNKHGWLRVTQLLAGEVEQFAIQGDATKHVVQLLHDRVRDDFIVSVTIEQDGATSTAQHAFGRDVGQARRAFSRLARAFRKEARK